MSLNDLKHEAKVTFLDKFGDAKTETFDYLKIDKADESKFKEHIIQQQAEIAKHKFSIGETVSFIEEKTTKPSEVTALNPVNHKASVKFLNIYGEEKTREVSYFDLEKMPKEKFIAETEKYKELISKFKFVIGEKVNWSKSSALKKAEIIACEVVSLDDLNHKAVVKYLDKENKEVQAKADYLDLTKIK